MGAEPESRAWKTDTLALDHGVSRHKRRTQVDHVSQVPVCLSVSQMTRVRSQSPLKTLFLLLFGGKIWKGVIDHKSIKFPFFSLLTFPAFILFPWIPWTWEKASSAAAIKRYFLFLSRLNKNFILKYFFFIYNIFSYLSHSNSSWSISLYPPNLRFAIAAKRAREFA